MPWFLWKGGCLAVGLWPAPCEAVVGVGARGAVPQAISGPGVPMGQLVTRGGRRCLSAGAAVLAQTGPLVWEAGAWR